MDDQFSLRKNSSGIEVIMRKDQKNTKVKRRLFFILFLVLGIFFLNGKRAAAQAEYETGIKSFPESYQDLLKKLKKEHPNWNFVAVQTGLTVSEVMKVEAEIGRNTIQSFVPSGGEQGMCAPFSFLSTKEGAYDWAADTYTLCDGSNWYAPCRQVVEYYLDPRNFLNEQDVFMFLCYNYQDNQSIEVVRKILSGSFMEGDYSIQIKTRKVHGKWKTKTVSGSYAKTFMDAGKRFGVSPYFLASRSLQEIGYEPSVAVTGTCKGYEGLYNYYNIGANDTPGAGLAAQKGLFYAKGGEKGETTHMRPWITPSLAITGGASFFYENYLSTGQNTVYFQKFSVVNPDYLYWHQFMSNIQAPLSEAKKLYQSYEGFGILDNQLTFYIPVYDEMPEELASLPMEDGNPNSFLKSISIGNHDGKKEKSLLKYLDPQFGYKEQSYVLTLPKEVTEVSISAKTVSQFAKVVKGAKTYEFPYEKDKETKKIKTKTVTLVCEAQDGTRTEYMIKMKHEEKKKGKDGKKAGEEKRIGDGKAEDKKG